MVEEFEKLKLETIFIQELFPETKEVLSILKSKSYIIAISSSTTKEIIVEYLQKKEVSNSVDLVLGFRPGFEKGKHHFDYLIDKYKLSSSSILYVGDSLKDMDIDLRKSELGRTFTGTELINQFKTVWGAVAWPGRNPTIRNPGRSARRSRSVRSSRRPSSQYSSQWPLRS